MPYPTAPANVTVMAAVISDPSTGLAMTTRFETGQSRGDISFHAMSSPKRDYTNGFIGPHSCNKKYDLALIINRHVFVRPLFNSARISSNERHLRHGQQEPSGEMHSALQRVVMILSISFLFVEGRGS